jgi:hypothetical protein
VTRARSSADIRIGDRNGAPQSTLRGHIGVDDHAPGITTQDHREPQQRSLTLAHEHGELGVPRPSTRNRDDLLHVASVWLRRT